MSRLYLSNEQSDVSSTYKTLYVGYRRPTSTAVAVSSTATTASGDGIQAKASDGTTALAWITKPFAAAVTITSIQALNIWAKEAAAAANASVGYELYNYTAGAEGATFWTKTAYAELPLTSGVGTGCRRILNVSTTGTATAFAVGDRLVLKLFIEAAGGAMGTNDDGVRVEFDGTTEGATGDSFLDIAEAIRVNEQQVGPGNYPTATQFGQGFYQNIIDGLNACFGASILPNTNVLTTVVDELGFQRDNL